jgi:hypothetical protein
MACKYVIKTGNGDQTFTDKAAMLKWVRENQILEANAKGTPSRDTNTLAKVLRQTAFNENNFNPEQLRNFQEELLGDWVKLEQQASYFYKIGGTIALARGLGTNFDFMDNLDQNLKDLGVNSEFKDEIPFDARYALTGDEQYKPDNSDAYTHKLTATAIDQMRQVGALSKTMFMERTPAFIDVTNKTVANLKDNLKSDEVQDLKNDLSSFMQIAAYKQWIVANDKQTSTLRNSLIYDGGDLSNIVDIVREAQELAPANTFLSYILPVSTRVKIGKKQQKNIQNKDLINTIEGRTRGKIEPDLIASLMDSFSELYQNPKTQYHAKALFDYLMVKDGLQFRNKSFIKMLPTVMFKEMSEATENGSKVLAASTRAEYIKIIKELGAQQIIDKEGNQVEYFSKEEKAHFNALFSKSNLVGVKDALYKKVFGHNTNELYNRFEKIYATDVTNQFKLPFIRPVANKKKTRAINFEDAGKVMNVNLFDERYKALRGTEEGNKYLGDSIDELAASGFKSTSEDAEYKGKEFNKLALQFKKFILVQGSKTKKLFQLESIIRDGKTLRGSDMTAEGENVPTGVSARYVETSPVGTSNTNGMADLGARPTREELMKNVDTATKQAPIVPTNTPATTHTDATEKEPVTPQPNAEVLPPSAGIFGGLQQTAYNSTDGIPDSFFSDEQIEDQTNNC